MLQLRVKHVSPLHNSNWKLHLKYHHYGKFTHIGSYCYYLHGYHHLDSPSKLKNRIYKKVHLKPKDSSTRPKAYATHKESYSKGWPCNCWSSRDMSK